MTISCDKTKSSDTKKQFLFFSEVFNEVYFQVTFSKGVWFFNNFFSCKIWRQISKRNIVKGRSGQTPQQAVMPSKAYSRPVLRSSLWNEAWGQLPCRGTAGLSASISKLILFVSVHSSSSLLCFTNKIIGVIIFIGSEANKSNGKLSYFHFVILRLGLRLRFFYRFLFIAFSNNYW